LVKKSSSKTAYQLIEIFPMTILQNSNNEKN